MKKRIICGVVAVMLVVAAVAFAACVDKPSVQEVTELTLPTLAENQMAVIVKNGDKDYTNVAVTLGAGGVDAKNMEDVLNYLNEQGMLSVVWQESSYGKYIVSIGNAEAKENGEFVSVLTSVEQDKGNWAGVTTYFVGNLILVSSQYGVSEMTVEAGAVVYFEIATY